MKEQIETDEPEIICCGGEYMPKMVQNRELSDLFRLAYESFAKECQEESIAPSTTSQPLEAGLLAGSTGESS